MSYFQIPTMKYVIPVIGISDVSQIVLKTMSMLDPEEIQGGLVEEGTVQGQHRCTRPEGSHGGGGPQGEQEDHEEQEHLGGQVRAIY